MPRGFPYARRPVVMCRACGLGLVVLPGLRRTRGRVVLIDAEFWELMCDSWDRSMSERSSLTGRGHTTTPLDADVLNAELERLEQRKAVVRRLLRGVLDTSAPATTARVATAVGLPVEQTGRLLHALEREGPDWLRSEVDLSPSVNEEVWFLLLAGSDELDRLDGRHID